jgi:hypothetical protein
MKGIEFIGIESSGTGGHLNPFSHVNHWLRNLKY